MIWPLFLSKTFFAAKQICIMRTWDIQENLVTNNNFILKICKKVNLNIKAFLICISSCELTFSQSKASEVVYLICLLLIIFFRRINETLGLGSRYLVIYIYLENNPMELRSCDLQKYFGLQSIKQKRKWLGLSDFFKQGTKRERDIAFKCNHFNNSTVSQKYLA